MKSTRQEIEAQVAWFIYHLIMSEKVTMAGACNAVDSSVRRPAQAVSFGSTPANRFARSLAKCLLSGRLTEAPEKD